MYHSLSVNGPKYLHSRSNILVAKLLGNPRYEQEGDIKMNLREISAGCELTYLCIGSKYENSADAVEPSSYVSRPRSQLINAHVH
jgi:hypothetical protein